MGTIFSTFDTTPSGAVAAIKAAILTSSDWSNPAGDRVTATTTRGADMVLDLADAAASATTLQTAVYRTTALADKMTRYLRWRSSGGATTDTLHCIVSAGKEHLYLSVEGPKAGEVNPSDTTYGCWRPYLFICDLVPYFASDTVASVVMGGGNSTANPPSSATAYASYVSRNAANNASWVSAGLETLMPPRGYPQVSYFRYGSQSIAAADSKRYVRPFVVFEDTAGIRGRLASFFHMGFNVMGAAVLSDVPTPTFTRVTIGSATYIGLAVNKALSQNHPTPFGITYDASDGQYGSPVVAVPYS